MKVYCGLREVVTDLSLLGATRHDRKYIIERSGGYCGNLDLLKGCIEQIKVDAKMGSKVREAIIDYFNIIDVYEATANLTHPSLTF
jgi:hypothetical protein